MRYFAAMKFLLWSLAVILLLALVNAIASWFGLDVATASEEPEPPGHVHGHGASDHAASHTPAAAHTQAPHAHHH